MKKFSWKVGLVLVLILPIFGFKGKENVDQGRVVQFDKAKGIMQLIPNKSSDHLNPDYSYPPPFTYNLPTDPRKINFIPKAGLRVKLNTRNNEIIIFDRVAQNFKSIKCTVIDQKENIAKNNPLVLENGNPKKFPVIDREKNILTIYSERQNILTTLSIPGEYLRLPEYTWNAGDEVLIHYMEEGKTRKVTNIAQIGFIRK
jgi:hypothetical protein